MTPDLLGITRSETSSSGVAARWPSSGERGSNGVRIRIGIDGALNDYPLAFRNAPSG